MGLVEADIVAQIQTILQDSSIGMAQKITDGIYKGALPIISSFHPWDWRIAPITSFSTVANQKTYAINTSPISITDFDGMISVKDVTNDKILDYYPFPTLDLAIVDETEKGNAEVFLITGDDELQFYPVYDSVVTINLRHKRKISTAAGLLKIHDRFWGAVVEGTLLYFLPRTLDDKVTPNPVWLTARANFYDFMNRLLEDQPRQSRKRVRFRLGSQVADHLGDVYETRDYAIG